MLNANKLLFILIIGQLTSCKHNTVSNKDVQQPSDPMMELSPLSLEDSIFNDSMQLWFVVENPAGRSDRLSYDFSVERWDTLNSSESPFLPGPLHEGLLVFKRKHWQPQFRYYLMAKEQFRGEVIAVLPLARFQINGTDQIIILKPAESDEQWPVCNDFDEWFTICDDYRFYIQYWIERQFESRYIQQAQWFPMHTSELINWDRSHSQ